MTFDFVNYKEVLYMFPLTLLFPLWEHLDNWL